MIGFTVGYWIAFWIEQLIAQPIARLAMKTLKTLHARQDRKAQSVNA
ncbi:hypothetical protein MKZ24_11515 [Paenibacillus sp. FSL R7-0297]